MSIPTIIDVRVSENNTFFSVPKYVTVTPVWSGVDRPADSSVSVPKALADRYVAALKAGAVYYNAQVETDIHGKTFVFASSRLLGRTLEVDLRAIGF